MDKSSEVPSGAESWATCDSYQGDFQDAVESLPGIRSNIWASDAEKVRSKFRRLRSGAEEVSVAKSPFFPQTAAEYAGLMADILEAEAAKLGAKIAEKEAALADRRRGGRWKTILVVGPSGEVETKTIPVYHSAPGRVPTTPAIASSPTTAKIRGKTTE